MSEPSAPDAIEHGKVREYLHHLAVEAGLEPPPEPSVVHDVAPPGFPQSIPVDRVTYTDWSLNINVPEVQVARVASADQVVEVCNWAAKNSYLVRASGANHNWSPLLLAPGTSANPPVMFVSTANLSTATFENGSTPVATFGPGITLDAASEFLSTLSNDGAGAAPGYAFPQLPAPGNLSLGGALAIGAHGTVVPPTDSQDSRFMGCLSNLITSFDAVVSDASGTYSVQTFDRADEDAAAFLVHLGRAFLTSVSMVVEPNYYLQLSCLFPDVDDLFSDPSTVNDNQFSRLLDECGRVEVLWFPDNTEAFVQTNKRQPTRVEPQVAGPYNFPWMNHISSTVNWSISELLKVRPSLTPVFTRGELDIAKLFETDVVLNGMSRDLEIYLKDSTIRVTLWGWALQLPRADVQLVAHTFFAKLQSLLASAKESGSYPVNAAMEIRCTTVDTIDGLPQGSVGSALATTTPVNPADPSVDTVIWLNVGTITGTPGSTAFYTELETWLIETYGTTAGRLRPEWSKAWAYSDEGPWTNTDTIDFIRDAFSQPSSQPHDFAWAAGRLEAYDSAGLFRSPLLDQLFEIE